jgi:hypothetical protein
MKPNTSNMKPKTSNMWHMTIPSKPLGMAMWPHDHTNRTAIASVADFG